MNSKLTVAQARELGHATGEGEAAEGCNMLVANGRDPGAAARVMLAAGGWERPSLRYAGPHSTRRDLVFTDASRRAYDKAWYAAASAYLRDIAEI